MNKYGVIMAGGGGTRFWPLSRQRIPKQLLNLTGKDLMINETIDRLSHIVDKKNLYIVTNAVQTAMMKKVTAGRVDSGHIISEPAARNTTACIGYTAIKIKKDYGDSIMVVTPSDHYIRNTDVFSEILNVAIKTAEISGKLVTIGVKPTFPSTGFGYMRYGKNDGGQIKVVTEFKEKPDEESAKEYVASGVYAWNSGIFVWRTDVILEKIKILTPDIYERLVVIANSLHTAEEQKVVEKMYSEIRNISIDYAIMEPSAAEGDVLAVWGEFGWNDIGSWDMMGILHTPNEQANVLIGDSYAVDTTNSILYSSGKTVTTVGVDNLIVVETEDVIMVCHKDAVQDVRKIVEMLEAEGRKELL